MTTSHELQYALNLARQTDRMFQGEGRYEAEVYKKMNGEQFPDVVLSPAGQAYYDDIKGNA